MIEFYKARKFVAKEYYINGSKSKRIEKALQEDTHRGEVKSKSWPRVVAVAGEKCGSCTCVTRKRRNWEDNKPLGRVPTVELKLKPWMLRSSPSFAFCPSASRSRESTFVPTVPGVWRIAYARIVMDFGGCVHVERRNGERRREKTNENGLVARYAVLSSHCKSNEMDEYGSVCVFCERVCKPLEMVELLWVASEVAVRPNMASCLCWSRVGVIRDT
ncbi:hypothetical protein VNO78_22962 [Psophocarpus tetragonolobus]|uniref:Uncharacterized protein n=1 Tax=Psophocarpus tetragonolobus TaxID=3891 RepID=A0AAN9XD14_PSOTE